MVHQQQLPRQQRNGGPPASVAHHRMPPVASGGPPHKCHSNIVVPVVDQRWSISGKSNLPISTFFVSLHGGSPVAFLPHIATGGPLDWSDDILYTSS